MCDKKVPLQTYGSAFVFYSPDESANFVSKDLTTRQLKMNGALRNKFGTAVAIDSKRIFVSGVGEKSGNLTNMVAGYCKDKEHDKSIDCYCTYNEQPEHHWSFNSVMFEPEPKSGYGYSIGLSHDFVSVGSPLDDTVSVYMIEDDCKYKCECSKTHVIIEKNHRDEYHCHYPCDDPELHIVPTDLNLLAHKLFV